MPKFYCTNCGQHIDADDSLSGVTATCPTCQAQVTVPGSPSSRAVALTANPYSPPQSYGSLAGNEMPPVRNYGGIRRLPYLGIIFGLAIVQSVLASGTGTSDSTVGFALLVVIVGSFFPVFYRLKNIGMNPWWCLLMIVPIANLFVGVRCLVFQEGYQDTKKLDKAGRIVTYIVVGFFGLCVLAGVISVITSK